MRNVLPTLIVTLLFSSGLAHAQTVYKITDANGKVRYSDAKPADTDSAIVETVTLPAEQNIIQADPQMQQWLQQKQSAEQEAAQSKTQALSGWQAEYDAAKAALKSAEDALAAGKDPQEGDFIGTATRFGGSAGAHPSEEFLEKVRQLEKNVTAARKHLKAVEAKKPVISAQ